MNGFILSLFAPVASHFSHANYAIVRFALGNLDHFGRIASGTSASCLVGSLIAGVGLREEGGKGGEGEEEAGLVEC